MLGEGKNKKEDMGREKVECKCFGKCTAPLTSKTT